MVLRAPTGSATPSQPPQGWLTCSRSALIQCSCVSWAQAAGKSYMRLCHGLPQFAQELYLSSGWWPVLLPKLCCGMLVPSQIPWQLGFTLHLPCCCGLAWRPAATGAGLTAVAAVDPLCSSSLRNVALWPLPALLSPLGHGSSSHAE